MGRFCLGGGHDVVAIECVFSAKFKFYSSIFGQFYDQEANLWFFDAFYFNYPMRLVKRRNSNF